MKNLSILFAVLFLIFGTTQISAQRKTKQREIILIEIFAPNSKEPNISEIIINRTSKAKFEVGVARNSACSHCTSAESAALPSDYFYTARAFRVGKDKANIGFEIEVDGECRTRKIFHVYRNKQTSIQLKCGVNLIAYYKFKSQKEN